ncbi:uncharacterized protein A4U43_C03F10800 [Asparagus officinalis]|uniref:Uncharacterized protein n=1 Tax=Asparagus officinalis TaxID=4686 RepID=A0A5P1FAT6_ASPOF|nr:uncharacterized protein LOC109832155 [Asparagus officinalis]ONK74853.1 uncharacterized protein A4U43_C03F10800 [Asparagus officinalis]
MKTTKEMIIERVITIEYLDPSMSQNLLCKFPDDSAFGFNYSESGIWSPLLPRGRSGSEAFGSSDKLLGTRGKAMKRRRKKKLNGLNKRLDFSPNPKTTPKRGWNWLLKAAARRFKVQKRAAIQMILPTL